MERVATLRKIKIMPLILYTFLALMVVYALFPVVHAILGSFKSNLELTTGGTIIPREWQFTNYSEAWKRANFARYTFNSLYICLFVTLGSLFISSMAGYVMARKDFVGKKLLAVLFISTMFMSSGAITLRPLYLLMVKVGLHKSLWGVILITINSQAANIFLVSRFVRNIPFELEEAAKIDGASTFGIYWRVVFPLLKPILGVVGLFSFRLAWNSFIIPSIFTMNKPNLRPLSVGVVSMKYAAGAAVEWNLMFAGACISIIPMIIIFVLANKSFIGGLTAGSVKG